jgi:hypothetical protein
VEIVLVVGVIVVAWLHGYRCGKRKNSVVEMSARDLRRALRQRK